MENYFESYGGDPRFLELLQQMAELHAKKQADYGTGKDPFANVRASQEWGIKPWVGALVRMNDKVTRLKTYCQKGTLQNEGVVDSLLDISVYALIAHILFCEEKSLQRDESKTQAIFVSPVEEVFEELFSDERIQYVLPTEQVPS